MIGRRGTALAGAVLALGLLAGCGDQPLPLTEGPPGASPADGLIRIVELSAQRARISDQVAAAKFGTGTAVTDAGREAAVVAETRADATRDGVDPDWAARIVSDQIAASTQVQNDLIRQWTDRPDTRPAQRPELARVRPQLDRIGDELVAALKLAGPARANEECPSTLAQAAVEQAKGLDEVHRNALGRSLKSVCDGAPG